MIIAEASGSSIRNGLNLTLGLLTPPVGAALYVASRVTECRPGGIMKSLLPFLLVTLVVMTLVSWQPNLVTAFIS